MGFWSRLKNLFSANINAFLDTAEDSQLALEEIVRDMNLELRRAKSYLAEAVVNMKKLERDAEKHEHLAKDFREKAKIILSDDDESNDYLAKEALVRQKENEQIAGQFRASFEKQKEAVDALKRNIEKMERKLNEARGKKTQLLARQQIADTQAKITAATSQDIEGKAYAEFKRIEEKIEDLSTRSEVEAEMARSNNIDDQLEEISFGSDVDKELENLKQELLLEAKEPTKQLPK